MNIYEKMEAITSELSAVAKNLRVGEGKSSYKAVGEADVLAAVKPLEDKYKVYSYPRSRQIVDSDILTTRKQYTDRNGNTQESETTKFFMRLETIYRFVNTEDPADFCEVTTYGDGVDSGDKAPGKAMTYGDKYALLKAYKIITGDDPDQKASEEEKVERSVQKEFEHVNPIVKCEDCGEPVKPFRKGGKVVKSVEEMVDGSKEKYGKVLCINCMRLHDNNEAEYAEYVNGLRHEDAGDRV